jgi:hypothetical protein
MTDEPNCSRCMFYRPGQNLGEGVCRRMPPQAFPIPIHGGITTAADFPPTKGTSWCGEYQQKMVLSS